MRTNGWGRFAVVSTMVALLALTLGAPAATPQSTAIHGPPPVVTAALTGPSVLTFGQPAVYGVSFEGNVVRHRWDLDNSGQFATDTGTKRTVLARFQRPGTYTVRVRGEGAGGTAELSKQVVVKRPTRAGIEYSPALPRPGQKVTFKLATRSEPGTQARLYAWKVNGLKPRTRSITLRRAVAGTSVRARRSATGQYRMTVGGGSEPTASATYTRTFPKAGVYKMKTTVIGADGTESTVEADIKVGSSRTLDQVMPSSGRRPSAQAQPCTVQAGGQCAAIEIAPNPAAQLMPTYFSNATPDFNWCIEIPIIKGNATDVGRLKMGRMQAKLDLGYPSPEQFFEPSGFNEGAFGNQVAGGQQGQTARAAQFKKGTASVCKRFKSQAVAWDFGDGTKLEPSAGQDKVTPSLTHTYATTGTKQVSLTVRRFYFDLTKFPSQSNEEAFAEAAREAFHKSEQELIDAGILKSYLQSVRRPLDVLPADCDGLSLNGIRVRAYVVPGANQDAPTADYIEESCFLERRVNGSNQSTWEPISGAQVSLNGIKLTVPEGDKIIVDEQNDRITSLNGNHLGLTFFHKNVYGYFDIYQAGSTPQIQVPQLQQDPELNRLVAPLPDYGGALANQTLYGFQTSGARILLSPNTTALARLSFKERPPLNGATPVVVLGGMTGRTAQADGADFTLDLENINIGPFRTKEFSIRHIPGTGWQGGGKFVLEMGAKAFELNAAHYPPSTPTNKCHELGDTAGPSGLAFDDNGNFLYAGGSVQGFTIPVGPAGINCFGASFRSSPFTLIGLVGGSIPPGVDLINFDVCVLVAVLKNNEKAEGCHDGILRNEYRASGDEVWVSGRGTVSLFKELELGTAGFDVHAGGGTLWTSAFGQVNVEFGPFYAFGRVTGLVVIEPNPGFEFTGEVEIGVGGCPACIDVMGIVSSLGVGACADVVGIGGGFLYRWKQGAEIFAGCDWSNFNSIRVETSRVAQTAFRSPMAGPLARASATAVNAEAGKPLAIQAIGTTGTPKIVITAPNGARVANTGSKASEEISGVTFLNIAPQTGRPQRGTKRFGTVPPQVLVTIPKTVAGKYSVDVQPGSPPLAKVLSATKQAPARVLARVRGKGSNRALDYLVRPVPGQSVEFSEEGGTVGRKIAGLGAGKGGSGRFRYPSLNRGPGLGGPRKVFATIKRNGVPIKKIQVASFTAPDPPKVNPPSEVRTRRSSKGVLKACWRSVARVTAFEVTVTATDGRIIRERVRATCATFYGFDASVGAAVAVKAIAPWGESATTAKATLVKRKPPEPVLAF